MKDCVFCKIINGDIQVEFLYKDSNVVVFKSHEPVCPTHLLIVPTKHIENFMNLDDEIMFLKEVAKKMIKDQKIEDGYKLLFNGGKYQSVPHVHLHLLAGNLENEDDILNNT